MRILYLDDDRLQLDLARQWLEAEGHVVACFTSGTDAIRAVEHDAFDLAILDWMVPDMSGEEVLRWIRLRGHRLPVMFVTVHGEEEKVAHILEAGADDYLVKPLRPREFLARINVLARHAGDRSAEGEIDAAPYRVRPAKGSVELHGRAVKMTPRMAALAIALFRKRGELVSRDYLYQTVWGWSEPLDTRTVDTHVSRVRTALELDGRHGWKLAAVYQHGYRLEKFESPGASDRAGG